MARSNLTGGDEDDMSTQPPGHSTADLGPSDSSDSGSDIAGSPGMIDDEGSILDDSGTISDLERAFGAARPVEDGNPDSDSAAGAAGRAGSARQAAGIEPDRSAEDPGGSLAGDDPPGIGVTRKGK